MPVETMISCDALTKRFGHFTTVDQVSLAVVRLNEPPEPSPGLSAATPWVIVGQIMRRERAPEGWKKSEWVIFNPRRRRDQRFSRPFRAAGLFASAPRHRASALSLGLYSVGLAGHLLATPAETITKRFGHFTAVDHVSFSVAKGFRTSGEPRRNRMLCGPALQRLNEPPEPSPGLSAAMPWVMIEQDLRPERAREG